MPYDYDQRNAIRWIAHWMGRGEMLAQIFQRNAERSPPLPIDLIVKGIPCAIQAVENARICNSAPGNVPLCKLPGCVFPEDE